MKTPDVLPPHSEEAEQCVLGSLLVDPQAIREIAPFLKPSHFYIVKHGWIYEAILACGDHADFTTVADALSKSGRLEECGGDSYLRELTGTIATALNVYAYARTVEDYSVRRAGLESATLIWRMFNDKALSLDDVTAGCMRALDSVVRQTRRSSSSELSHEVGLFLEAVEARYNDPELAAGVPTGFADIDKVLGGGAHRGELIIIAGRPGMGKTSLLNAIALNAGGGSALYRPTHKYTILYASLEMGREELVNRFVSAESGIDSQRLRAGRLQDGEWEQANHAAARVSGASIHLDDSTSSTVEEITQSAAYLQFRGGLDAVMVDYLGLLGGSGDAYERVSANARKLKNMARRLNVPLFVACQLSRECEKRANKRPQLSDLRDSGEIEQAADVVMFVYRDEYYDGNTEVKNLSEIAIAKNRNGPTGMAELFFDKRLTRFSNLKRSEL